MTWPIFSIWGPPAVDASPNATEPPQERRFVLPDRFGQHLGGSYSLCVLYDGPAGSTLSYLWWQRIEPWGLWVQCNPAATAAALGVVSVLAGYPSGAELFCQVTAIGGGGGTPTRAIVAAM
jgi:hypothetical protein